MEKKIRHYFTPERVDQAISFIGSEGRARPITEAHIMLDNVPMTEEDRAERKPLFVCYHCNGL